jgi:hypothetical protein
MSIVALVMSIPAVVEEWLTSFAAEYKVEQSPTKIIHSLVQLGVETPNGGCDCNLKWAQESGSEWEWLHHNHRAFNRKIWDILMTRPEMVAKLRRVLRDDLKTLSRTEEQEKEIYRNSIGRHNVRAGKDALEGFMFQPCGKIVQHSYACDLLAHFLHTDPAAASWI